jgi:hypothetical protein
MAFFQSMFAFFKFLFGLGALLTLLGIGALLLWFCLRSLAQRLLAGQPAHHYPLVRKFFLEP